jgi:hypothetical protein
MSQSFTAHRGQVFLAGSALSDHRIDDLLTFFEERAREAERAADEARRAFNALEDARIAAVDYRQDRGGVLSVGRAA